MGLSKAFRLKSIVKLQIIDLNLINNRGLALIKKLNKNK